MESKAGLYSKFHCRPDSVPHLHTNKTNWSCWHKYRGVKIYSQQLVSKGYIHNVDDALSSQENIVFLYITSFWRPAINLSCFILHSHSSTALCWSWDAHKTNNALSRSTQLIFSVWQDGSLVVKQLLGLSNILHMDMLAIFRQLGSSWLLS